MAAHNQGNIGSTQRSVPGVLGIPGVVGVSTDCERSRKIHLDTEQNIDLFVERRYSGYGEPSPNLYSQTV